MIPLPSLELVYTGYYHRFSSSLQPTLHLARQVYSEEAPDLKTTYLSELHPPKSMYADTVSALTTPQDPMMSLWIHTNNVSGYCECPWKHILIVFGHIHHSLWFCRSTSIMSQFGVFILRVCNIVVTPTPLFWQDYKNPVQPIRQKEPSASSVGHRGASHWSSTYKTSHDDNAIVGSVPWKLDHLNGWVWWLGWKSWEVLNW